MNEIEEKSEEQKKGFIRKMFDAFSRDAEQNPINVTCENEFSTVLIDLIVTTTKVKSDLFFVSEMCEKINGTKRVMITEEMWNSSLDVCKKYLEQSAEKIKHCEQCFEALKEGKEYASKEALKTFKKEKFNGQINQSNVKYYKLFFDVRGLEHEEDNRSDIDGLVNYLNANKGKLNQNETKDETSFGNK